MVGNQDVDSSAGGLGDVADIVLRIDFGVCGVQFGFCAAVRNGVNKGFEESVLHTVAAVGVEQGGKERRVGQFHVVHA